MYDGSNFMRYHAPRIAYANPSLSISVTRLGPKGSPRHRKKLADKKRAEEEEAKVKAVAAEKGLEEYMEEPAPDVGEEGKVEDVEQLQEIVSEGREEIVVEFRECLYWRNDRANPGVSSRWR